MTGRTSPTRDLDTAPSRPLPSPNPIDEPTRPLSTASGLARSGTLSWQQRPSSRDGAGARQRPLSGFATVRNLPRPPSQDESDQEPTRKDIAASLAQKDPTWFRQTQDRGAGSAAFRKNQVEDTPEPLHATTMRLPGMAQARELSKSPAPESRIEREPLRSPLEADRFKRGSTPDMVALRDSINMDRPQTRLQQELNSSRPSSLEQEISDASTPSLGRTSSVLSSNRPVSPTKGLGGFVESAMMRRSDSVSKRWSVKANTGLKRGDSVAGGRPTSFHSRGLSRDVQSSKEGTPSSPLASSRPGSSHGRDQLTSTTTREKSMSVEPPDNTAVVPEDAQNISNVEVEDAQLDRSPSKTMDPRRWSPTKATWLESALQAESPKPPPLKEEQPKWKVDLQRSRSRASRDVSPDKRPSKQEVSTPAAKAPLASSKPPPPQASDNEKTILSTHSKAVADKDLSKEETTPSVGAKPEETPTDDAINKEPGPSDNKPTNDPVPAEPKESIEFVKKPPVLKPKPPSSATIDFRSTLKNRGTGPSQSTETEPEFKAVFGKLKRATTQNYVAPDELKTNILTGKAALNATGGPQKTKRVDEFKESILAKKEAMKATSSKSPQRSESPTKEEAPVPEALARRKTLSKASVPNLTSAKATSHGTSPTPAHKPAIASKPFEKTSTETQKAEVPAPAVPAKPIHTMQREMKPSEQLQEKEEKNTPGRFVRANVQPVQTEPKSPPAVLAAKPIPVTSKPVENRSWTTTQNPASPPAKENETAESLVKTELPVGSKLASRLNPNLAAMLSRGGSPRPQASRTASNDEVTRMPSLSPATTRKEEESAGSLTHMTKARAKGPKRRAPKAEPAAAAKADKEEPTLQPTTARASVPPAKAATVPVANVSTAPKEILSKPSMGLRELPQTRIVPISQAPAKTQSETKATMAKVEEPKVELAKAKPVIATKSPELRKVSSSASIDEKLRASPKPSPPSKPSWSPAAKQTQVAKAPMTEAAQSASPARPVKSNLFQERLKDVQKFDETKDVKAADTSVKPISTQGSGLATKATPPSQKPIIKPRALAEPTDNAKASTSKLPQEIRAIVESYVGPILKDYEKADFDSQQFLLDGKDSEQRIKTVNQSINEVTGDGKKSSLPAQQEHILYEESMYVVTHTFSTSSGTNTSEVYLWCGDRVSDAAIEDAQVFCRRDAREHNTKLEVVKQGKETSRLLQALGGILIIRRSKGSALYMLCGRRHLGHIVFDEIEMESENLCPGYTYLISAQYGKLYLWKGKGAGADEIGSARLIGMDLGLTGEIEEVDEGAESSSFWDAFGSRKQTQWSADWSKRAELNGYPTVMYRVEHERAGLLGNLWGLKRAASPSKGQQAKATCERLVSFSQSDLESSAIHMVDAYRNIYVVVTRQCSSKAAELVTALHLAQEFAMLSPATQDRPLLPACYLVVGDLTADSKACFRKWSALQGHSLAKKESICVPLEEAMEALNL